MYCHMAARRDAIANLKCFLRPQDISNLMSMVSFTFTMRRHLIRLASASFTSSGKVRLGSVCRLATKQNVTFTESR